MGDIVITVPIKKVFREVARRTAVATRTDPFYAQKTTEEKQYSQLQGEGDRITSDFTKEAAKEVLKAFLSRQGGVNGLAYEYDSVITPAVTAVKQKETVTLTGNGISAQIVTAGGLTSALIMSEDGLLSTIAANFVTTYYDAYLAQGIVITNVDDTIVFEAAVAGVPFDAPVVNPGGEGDLGGDVAHTTANVVGVTGVTAGNIVYRFSENPYPLDEKQTASIVERLTDNTRDAIVYYVLVSLYRTDGNANKETEVLTKALSLIDELSGDLYRLHD